jgi:hypothetical protein
MNWQQATPDEKHAAVRQAVQIEGLSYGQAAERLGTTRLAIAGVVERSGPRGKIVTTAPAKLAQQRRSASAARKKKAPRSKNDKPKKPHQGLSSIVPLVPALETQPLPPGDVWRALPGSTPIAIELHTTGCRWTIDQPPAYVALYCNEPVKEGSPYCAAHSAWAFREPPAAIHLRKETA